MKKLIKNIIVFFIFSLLTILLLNYFIDTKLNNENYYKIPTNKNNIILGHSHSSCAYNDSLIDHTINFSSAMEGYFYTYYKTKKIISSNKHINTIFVEYTNDQISSFGNERIWGKYLANQLPKYSNIIDKKGLFLLFKNNIIVFLKSMNTSFKNKLFFLMENKNNLFQEFNWGGYTPRNKIMTEKLYLNFIKKETNNFTIIKGDYSVSEVNLWYLGKLVNLCKENKIKIIFIRTPCSLPNFKKSNNEAVFLDILNNEFNDIPFIDLEKFPLLLQDFADNKHLNVSGSKKVSNYFNFLLKNGITEMDSIQKFVNSNYSILQK